MLEKLYQAIRNDAAPNFHEENGLKYSDKKLYPITLQEPETVTVTSLKSICDYINANEDDLDLQNVILVVNSPRNVTLHSCLQKPTAQRFCYIKAQHQELTLPIGKYFDAEEFNVLVQATMIDGFDKEKLLRYIANIKSVGEIGLYDDGKAQQITVKKGIAAVEKDILPNPVTLAPYRSFDEIIQPESQFIFRVKENDGKFFFQLTEADGGGWRSAAHVRIAHYLRENTPDITVIS